MKHGRELWKKWKVRLTDLVAGTVVLTILLTPVIIIVAKGCRRASSNNDDYSDLILTQAVVSAESNAFTYFEQAADCLHWPTNQTSYWAWPVKTRRALLATNAETMLLIQKGLACRSGISTNVLAMSDDENVRSLRYKLIRVLDAAASVAVTDSRYPEYVSYAADQLRFSRMLIEGGGDSALYGFWFYTAKLQEVATNGVISSLPLSDLAPLELALADCGDPILAYRTLVCANFTSIRRAVADVSSGRTSVSQVFDSAEPAWLLRYLDVSFDPADTSRIAANIARAQLTLSTQDCKTANADWLKTPSAALFSNEEGWSNYLKFLSGNAGGKALVLNMHSGGGERGEYFNRLAETRTCYWAINLKFACMRYRDEHGVYPPSLTALVPKHIPAVPNDPFDGLPMRYEPARGIIYSVGADFVDSGGSTNVPPSAPIRTDPIRVWEDMVFFLPMP